MAAVSPPLATLPSVLDRPIAAVWARTPREIACVLLGVSMAVAELATGNLNYGGNVLFLLAGTAIFAMRLHVARVVAVCGALGSLAQWALPALHPGPAGADLNWRMFAALAVLPLLASRDLVQRFDRGRSRIPRAPNVWAGLSGSELFRFRFSLYALSVAVGVLSQVWAKNYTAGHHRAALWVLAVDIAIVAVLLLLALGRAGVLRLLPLVGVVVLAGVAYDRLRGGVGALTIAPHGATALAASGVLVVLASWPLAPAVREIDGVDESTP